MQDRSTLLTRIYRLKLIVVGLVLVAGGVGLSLLADQLTGGAEASHLLIAILRGLSDVLLVAGAIGIAVDFFTGRDKDAADTERTRSVLKELAPDFTDAVLKGLAVDKSDLQRVASPELLDAIATNAMALRLGDDQFAAELYRQIRDQAISPRERWQDVEVDVRLSTAVERDTEGVPLFDVTVQWEFTVTPTHTVQTFACVSSRDDYEQLLAESPEASVWYMTPRHGIDAGDRATFELLEYTVDGQLCGIDRRKLRGGGQKYVAQIGDRTVEAGHPVRIRVLYRTIAVKSGHWVTLDFTQPARGASIRVDYSDTDISRLNVFYAVGNARPTISRLPAQVSGRVVSVDMPGWLLPRTGLALIWTTKPEEELRPSARPPRQRGRSADRTRTVE